MNQLTSKAKGLKQKKPLCGLVLCERKIERKT